MEDIRYYSAGCWFCAGKAGMSSRFKVQSSRFKVGSRRFSGIENTLIFADPLCENLRYSICANLREPDQYILTFQMKVPFCL